MGGIKIVSSVNGLASSVVRSMKNFVPANVIKDSLPWLEKKGQNQDLPLAATKPAPRFSTPQPRDLWPTGSTRGRTLHTQVPRAWGVRGKWQAAGSYFSRFVRSRHQHRPALFCSIRLNPHGVQDHGSGRPLYIHTCPLPPVSQATTLDDPGHLSPPSGTAQFSATPSPGWRCPDWDLKSHGCAPRPGPLSG